MKDPRKETESIDPRREPDDEIAKMHTEMRRTSSQLGPAVERMAVASRGQIDAAEQLARTARKSRPRMAAVKSSKAGATGDLTARFAALKG